MYWTKKKTEHDNTQREIEECISAFIFVKENGHFASMIRALSRGRKHREEERVELLREQTGTRVR